MIDQSSQFMAILTAVGEAKQANADAMNIPWTFSQMGVGDANGADPQPNRGQTKLINERRRAPLNQVKIDPKNTNVIIAEQVIPENVGGWWIREIGLYDADGDLVAVANCAPSFKPELAQGSGKTQVVRINFIVSSAANVTLKIDPSVVLATRQYVDDRIIEVLPPTRKPGSYTKVLIDKRGVVIEGSNPETLADNGIKDAYTKTQVNDLLQGKAALDSPVLTGTPTAPTALVGSNNLQLANTAFVQAAINALIAGAPGALDTLQEIAAALGGDKDFANTIINQLATKADKAVTLGGYGIGDAYTKAQINEALSQKAPLHSPTLSGLATCPTPDAGNNSQQLANTAFVQATITALIGGAPGALDTLKELSEALGGDENFSNTVLNALSGKADKATTLGGYGITDALPLAGGVVSGNVTLGSACSLYLNTSDQPAWAAGVIAGRYGAERAGVGFAGNNENIVVAFLGLGGAPWESGNGVRVRANGVEITGPISGDGSGLKKLQWESLLNCPQSLSGYNIAVVTQSVFNEGKDDSAPVTTKKLFNGIFKAIGYTPVRQGGGIGQAAFNTLYLGFSAQLQRPTLTVDETDFGALAFTSDLRSLPFTKEYVSPQQAFSNGGLVSVTHGLGQVPKLVVGELVCVGAENGWQVGDIQMLSLSPDNDDSSVIVGFATRKDATHLYARCGFNGAYGVNINTGSTAGTVSSANWRLVLRAFA